MSLNQTPSSERVHIAFFGRRNAGKSSLINAVTSQNLSIVSEEKGTTTDPVKKTMELLPLGPVVIIDTAGIDDSGTLGKLRVEKTMEILSVTHIAIIVTDNGIGEYEEKLISALKDKKIPYIICHNKCDITKTEINSSNEINVSATSGEGIEALKNMLGAFAKPKTNPLISDLISENDIVVLVIPVDESAPKGRLILPQQMVLREVLDSGAVAVTLQPEQLSNGLAALNKTPKLVVCDSQIFGQVSEIVPKEIPLTSFSILMVRYKLGLEKVLEGANVLDRLKDGDKILISEGCTHHRQCGDIGTVKLPAWIREYTGKTLDFSFTAGGEFPADVSGFALVIHCGGCMLSDAAMRHRIETAAGQGVPFTNYGLVISKTQRILERATEIFN